MGSTSLLVFVTFNLLCGIDATMSSCCPNKTVGGIPYTLVTEGPTGQYGPLIDYGCSEDCVYQPAGRPQDRVCFAPGVLETQCHPGPYKIQCNKPPRSIPVSPATTTTTRSLHVLPSMNRQRQKGCSQTLKLSGIGKNGMAIGIYNKQAWEHNNKPVYKFYGDVSTRFQWCVFQGKLGSAGGHWKVDSCKFMDSCSGCGDWSQGIAWSKVPADCPEDIGPNWRYYSWTGGSDSGPIDTDLTLTTVQGSMNLLKRVNVNTINFAAEIAPYNQALEALKASTDTSGFKNIANYHGYPYMCDADLQGVGTVEPCCLNHPRKTYFNQLFTPWHRLFTSQMEQAFNLEWQKLSPGSSPLAMPYWDWTEPLATPALPAFAEQGQWKNGPCKDRLDGTTGCRDGRGITYRSFNGVYYARLAKQVKDSYCYNTVIGFNNQIVNPHDNVHVMVGGDMGAVIWSAYDPIFYLHHSNVEKQYVFWQELMALQGKPIAFNHNKGIFKMQPFDRSSNPFSNTKDNPTAEDGLDYKAKFGYEYEDLTFEGLSPQEFYNKYIQPAGSYCSKLLEHAAGVTVKKSQITAIQTFDLVSGRTGERLENIGSVTQLKQTNPVTETAEPNIYLHDVRDKVENTTFDTLDKTHHYEVSKYESSNGSALPLDDTYKPVAIVQDPVTNSRIFRLHTDHIKRYSPNLIHCQLDSKVEFLNSDGNYSKGVQLLDGQGGKTINGQFEVVKLSNKFEVTFDKSDGGEETTVVNIGYDPNCHLQCGPDGLAVSEDADFFIIAWQLGWLQARANSVTIAGCSVTVFVAWCAGAQATDIVQVTKKEDFEACTNLDGLPDLTYGSDGEHVDGFISVKKHR